MSENVGRIDLGLGINYKQFNKDLAGIAPRASNLIKGSFSKLGIIAATAFSAKAIGGFIKSSIDIGSSVAEIQNVVDVTFGSMSKDIQDFANTAIQNFGLTELAAKEYTSYMGAMLKSTGVTGKAMRDMSIDLTKLTADLASFYNMDEKAMFDKVLSAMSGMPMPLKQLGINMNIASLEAYALANGIKKSYNEMSQSEQMILRYNYLMSVTGDMQGDFSRNSHNWAHSLKVLRGQWSMLKATLGQGFINILQPIITGFNILIRKIQVAAEYFKAFTELIFGNAQGARKTADDLGYIGANAGKVSDGLEGAGKAAKKAGKEAKKSIMPFDDINAMMQDTADNASGLSDEMEGAGGIDLGTATSGELDIDTSHVEEKFKSLTNMVENFYNNWGVKDIFDGIKAGAALVNFDNIKESFKVAFSGWNEISKYAFESLQPIFQAGGQALGTIFKYGIASVGNFFEPIAEGFANFTVNMQEPIQDWITEVTISITNGLNSLNSVFDIIGTIWLNSIEKYKPAIAASVEGTFTNVTKTIMLIVDVITDTFEIITDNMHDFAIENKESMQNFMEDMLGMFTDIWGLINDIWRDTLEALSEFWEEWGVDIVDRVSEVALDIYKWFLYLWHELVKPLWDTMLSWMKKIWNSSLKDIIKELLGFVGRAGDLILTLWEGILKPLLDLLLSIFVPIFKRVFTDVITIVGIAVDAIGGIIEGLLKILNGLLDFIIGVFTGDWERAWNGIGEIFTGIWEGLSNSFKLPFNVIIKGINDFIRALNKIKIPDWVPGVGGRGFNIDEIPLLARGGIIDQPTLAMVGEQGKEAVVPLEDTAFVDTLANAVANAVGNVMAAMMEFSSGMNNSENSDNSEIILELDGTQIGRILLPYINEELQRMGFKPIFQMT